jgi:hypothetical protein
MVIILNVSLNFTPFRNLLYVSPHGNVRREDFLLLRAVSECSIGNKAEMVLLCTEHDFPSPRSGKRTSTSFPATSSSEEYVDLDWSENAVARASPEPVMVSSTVQPPDTPIGSGMGVDDSDFEEAEGSGAQARSEKPHRSDGAMFGKTCFLISLFLACNV